MSRASLIVIAAVACGGGARRSSPPPDPFDAAGLAAELDAQLARLATIVHTHRTDCTRLATELRSLFVEMDASLGRARQAQQDPEHARQLTTALRGYDHVTARRMEQIDADFTTEASCVRDPAVRDVLQTMPTL